MNDLSLAPWIGVAVALSHELEKADPNRGFVSDTTLNVKLLKRGRTPVNTALEEHAELLANELGSSNVLHLDAVLDLGVDTIAVGHVLNEDDGHLLTHQSDHDTLNITESLILPVFSGEVTGDLREAMDDEAVLIPLVLAPVGQLGVDGNLVLDDFVQTTMILLKHDNAVLENSIRSGCSQGLVLW